MKDMFNLSGKTALVTGATRGIGQAISVCLANAGAEVICAGRSSADETLALIAKEGGKGRALKLDVSNPIKAAKIVENIGPLDILVNNAGINRREDAVDFTEKDWDDVIEVNLKSVFFLCQAFARSAFARGAGGSIINIASMTTFQGGVRIVSYTSSKSGLGGMTKALANEWASKDINVNAIAPGYIATDINTSLHQDPTNNKVILDRIPAGRWGEPNDIGGTAVFLASNAAKYVNGAVINVDGGWLAR